MKVKEATHGGARPNAGAKLKYGEPTVTLAFRVPASKAQEIKKIIKDFLEKYLIK